MADLTFLEGCRAAYTNIGHFQGQVLLAKASIRARFAAVIHQLKSGRGARIVTAYTAVVEVSMWSKSVHDTTLQLEKRAMPMELMLMLVALMLLALLLLDMCQHLPIGI